jgi:phospholipid N-methyltransferase
MSQLTLWNETNLVPVSSANGEATEPARNAEPPTTTKENRAALKCMSAAQQLQKHIDAKHSSANNMLTKIPTRKRLADAESFRREAIRLEKIQTLLRQLSEMHSNGSISLELANITSRAAVEGALFNNNKNLRGLYDAITGEERKSDRVLRLTNEARLMRIPGYFPTPEPLAQQLIKIACIEPGQTILEPSAGTGNLIDVARSLHSDVTVSFCELNCFLLDILRAKYDGLPDVHFIGRDCLELESAQVKPFDRIVMNPPFEQGQDMEHVLRMFPLLKPGGILATVVSAGVLCRSDKRALRFREFLKTANAVVHDVPTGSFKSSGAGVESKILCIRSAGRQKP